MGPRMSVDSQPLYQLGDPASKPLVDEAELLAKDAVRSLLRHHVVFTDLAESVVQRTRSTRTASPNCAEMRHTHCDEPAFRMADSAGLVS
jgi:hypothetical protein